VGAIAPPESHCAADTKSGFLPLERCTAKKNLPLSRKSMKKEEKEKRVTGVFLVQAGGLVPKLQAWTLAANPA
jgi:hypothetical protein